MTESTPNIIRKCAMCKQEKPLSEWYMRQSTKARGKPSSYCKSCFLEHQRRSAQKAYDDVIVAYGGKCVCCGEEEKSFLVLDHIDGRSGTNHGKSGGVKVARKLVREGFPPSVRILCANCHMSHHRLNGCIHTKSNPIDSIT